MRLLHRLNLFLAAAIATPTVVAMLLLYFGERDMKRRIQESRVQAASRLADSVLSDLQEIFDRVENTLSIFPLERATLPELRGLLGLIYKQSEQITQVSLLDESGGEIVPGVYLREPLHYPEYRGRRAIGDEAHLGFVAALPVAKALLAEGGSVVVAPVHPLSGKLDELAFSFVLPPKDGPAGSRLLLAVEVSLEQIRARILSGPFEAVLVDEDGRPIAHRDRSIVAASKPLPRSPAVSRIRAGEPSGSYVTGDAVTAFARVPLLDWGVVLSESAEHAWGEVGRARQVIIGWTLTLLGLLLTGGALFVRRITRDLGKVVSGAEALGRGDLRARVYVDSRDELGVLATAFNRMAEELSSSRAQIEAFNRELSQRMEERGQELEAAQKRLWETAKLAALGQLGAGVAHEINNPMTTILGNVQLLMLRTDSEHMQALLKKVEKAAKRCKEVTENLLRFSETPPLARRGPYRLIQLLQDAFSMTEQRIKAQGIVVGWEYSPDDLLVHGNRQELMQAFFNLFANARNAMPAGGEMLVSIRRVDWQWAEISVRDTGRGIPKEHLERIFEPFFTTKDVWNATGLGLSVTYRIVSDHGGRILVESELGKGSLFRVLLPLSGGAG